MTARTSDITAADWSPQVGNPGNVVTDLADIDQCIGIILTTPKGSDPHRPLFGCDAWLWIDKPASIAIPNVIAEAVDSLTEWEPRLELISVTAAQPAIGHAQITVAWKPVGDDTLQSTEVLL